MHRHAEAEHQNYRVHVKCNGVRAIKYIKDAIVAEIDNERIDGVIACFSKTDKDIIDNCTARIRNYKTERALLRYRRFRPHFEVPAHSGKTASMPE